MSQKNLYEILDYVDHSRAKRKTVVAFLRQNPSWIPKLLEIAYENQSPVSSRACWVLDFTLKTDIELLFPYIKVFTDNLGSVHLDSSVRPIAKICEHLIIAYFAKDKNAVQEVLKKTHREKITTACFDWLISEQKVAPQAYAMICLLHLGEEFDWIHPELLLILEKNYHTGSAAYKARSRQVFAKLKRTRS